MTSPTSIDINNPVYFWRPEGEYGFLGQWWPSSFSWKNGDEKYTYANAEQYFSNSRHMIISNISFLDTWCTVKPSSLQVQATLLLSKSKKAGKSIRVQFEIGADRFPTFRMKCGSKTDMRLCWRGIIWNSRRTRSSNKNYWRRGLGSWLRRVQEIGYGALDMTRDMQVRIGGNGGWIC